jgi:hypothetical protein
MEDYLLACQKFLKQSHEVTRLAKERANFKLSTTLISFHFLNIDYRTTMIAIIV